MKKKFHKIQLIIKPAIVSTLKFLSILIISTLFIFTSDLKAQPYLKARDNYNQKYNLENIGILKPVDNVDGIFSEFVHSVYMNYFDQQNRFSVISLSKTDEILSKYSISYEKIINDPDLLKKIGQKNSIQSFIRTHIVKTAQEYFFTIEWIHAHHNEVIGKIEFQMNDIKTSSEHDHQDLQQSLYKKLKQLIQEVPFYANIKGIKKDEIIVNLGEKSLLEVGDTLTIGTIDSIKIHPKFRTINEWNMSPVGEAKVVQIDKDITFAEITKVYPDQSIEIDQKIIQIQHKESPLQTNASSNRIDIQDDLNENPKTGWFGFSPWLGSYNRNYSSNPTSLSGGGVLYGAKLEQEIWFTKDWFGDFELSYATWTLSQKNLVSGADTPATQAGGSNGSVFSYKFNAGYTFLSSKNFFGSKAWLKLGYKSQSYSAPISLNEGTGPTSFNSVFVGIGGDMAIYDKWGAITNMNFKILSFISANWLPSSQTSNSDLEFYLAAYYRFSKKIIFRAGFEIRATNIDFNQGNLNQKIFNFTPSVHYYF